MADTKKYKICCTTYKNICICQKKVVPLHHERRIKEISRKPRAIKQANNSHS